MFLDKIVHFVEWGFHVDHDSPDSLMEIKEPQRRGSVCCSERPLHPVLHSTPSPSETVAGFKAQVHLAPGLRIGEAQPKSDPFLSFFSILRDH
jgi:hypothetical protein